MFILFNYYSVTFKYKKAHYRFGSKLHHIYAIIYNLAVFEKRSKSCKLPCANVTNKIIILKYASAVTDPDKCLFGHTIHRQEITLRNRGTDFHQRNVLVQNKSTSSKEIY